MTMQCPESGLILPKQFVDEKKALKKVIDDWLDATVMQHQHLDYNYYIVFHAKFNKFNPEEFELDAPVITDKLPGFTSNQMVFWVSNKQSICELLWVVPPKKPGQKKLKVEFNTEGVAYLQAKGAMPKPA